MLSKSAWIVGREAREEDKGRDDAGTSTASIVWTTPFVATTSLVTSMAPSTVTSPPWERERERLLLSDSKDSHRSGS